MIDDNIKNSLLEVPLGKARTTLVETQGPGLDSGPRSEEHTSELQSR